MYEPNLTINADGSIMLHTNLSKSKCGEILRHKEIREQTMGGINVPVYGHLVTADQLNLIEKRKGLLGFHQTNSLSKSILSGLTVTPETSSETSIYANLGNMSEPMDITTCSSSENQMGSPNRTSESLSSLMSTYLRSKADKKIEDDDAGSYYHYPDFSYCQANFGKSKLYVNTSNAQETHSLSHCLSFSFQNSSKTTNDRPPIETNPKSDYLIEKKLTNMPAETDVARTNNPRCSNTHHIVKMSVDLIKTYKNINEIYYRKKRRLKELTDESYLKKDRKRNTENEDFRELNKSNQKLINADCTLQTKNSDTLSESNKRSEFAALTHVDSRIPALDSFLLTGNIPQSNVNTTISSRDAGSYEYLIKSGEIWKSQYSIEKLIGTGSFGQVVRAKDLKSGEFVAIKIIKNKRNYVEQAYIEISLLKDIGKFQETEEISQEWGANYIVKLKSYFNHRGHLCLVFELLTYTLYELLKNTNFRGVSLNLTRKFAQQICQALVFLSKPQVQIIHCDLKPENILLLHPRRSAIKVVDFGSSCHANRRIYYYIQSRFYRSPEIILNLDYSYPIDMWSLGCIMAELHTGQPLFIGQFEHEQILRIIEVVGMPPNCMIDNGKKSLLYFDRFPSNNPLTKYTYRPKIHREKDGKKITFQGISSRKLSDIIGVYTDGPQGRRINEPGHSSTDYEKFLDLLQKMMIIDPKKRIKPDEALKHPFFIRSTPTSDTNPFLPNTSSKTIVPSRLSTSYDKNLLPLAADTKLSSVTQLSKITDSAEKLPVNFSLKIQTPPNQLLGGNVACDSSNFIETSTHKDSTYLSLATILTTTAN